MDDYDPSDEHQSKRAYEEFVLEEVDARSLKDIEKSLKENKIDSSNKEDIIDFLMNLLSKLRDVKKREYEYEGEGNINVNNYINRVEALIKKVNQI